MSCAPKRLPRVRQRRMEATAGERRPVGACHLSGLTYISSHCSLATTHAFDVLGDPVRRRILELLADGMHRPGPPETLLPPDSPAICVSAEGSSSKATQVARSCTANRPACSR